MTPQRRKEINRLADHVRQALRLAPPIDVDNAVRELGGKIDTLSLNAEEEAMIEKIGEDSFLIKIRQQTSTEARRRFSVAHELGHLFIHMGYLIEPVKWTMTGPYFDSVRFRRGHSEEEYEANEFAGAFLMPAKEFREVAEKHRQGNAYSIVPIARQFDVSVEAASTRGRWLGIFSWD